MTLRRILSAVFVPLFLFMAVVFPMEKSYAAESMTLPYSMSVLEQVGSQKGKGGRYNWACASFCVAYAHAIITGEVRDPSYYWASATNVSCQWGLEDYSRKKYGELSKLQVLQRAYDELILRRLPILYVTMPDYYAEGVLHHDEEHWVLAVGYQNVTSRDSLVEGNFNYY